MFNWFGSILLEKVFCLKRYFNKFEAPKFQNK